MRADDCVVGKNETGLKRKKNSTDWIKVDTTNSKQQAMPSKFRFWCYIALRCSMFIPEKIIWKEKQKKYLANIRNNKRNIHNKRTFKIGIFVTIKDENKIVHSQKTPALYITLQIYYPAESMSTSWERKPIEITIF